MNGSWCPLLARVTAMPPNVIEFPVLQAHEYESVDALFLIVGKQKDLSPLKTQRSHQMTPLCETFATFVTFRTAGYGITARSGSIKLRRASTLISRSFDQKRSGQSRRPIGVISNSLTSSWIGRVTSASSRNRRIPRR